MQIIKINRSYFWHKIISKLPNFLFILFVNRFSSRDTLFKFNNDKLCIYEANIAHYILKKRANIYRKGLKFRTQLLFESYGLDNIRFQKNDLVLDVGANVGDLALCFLDQSYIAYEPSMLEFECLRLNLAANHKAYNFAISDSNSITDFYVSTEYADSSFFMPKVFEEKQKIQTFRIDHLVNNKVKLLKIDAEGAEYEVIKGIENIIKKIEYIAIDLGFEKGIDEISPAPEVINFLLRNKFEMQFVSKMHRYLFKRIEN
jgi:FkbM family methyltransferase